MDDAYGINLKKGVSRHGDVWTKEELRSQFALSHEHSFMIDFEQRRILAFIQTSQLVKLNY